MIDFTLDTGHSLTVDCYQYSQTYGGVMEGGPSEALNQSLLTSAVSKAGMLWGERKVHLVPPVYAKGNPARPTLPECEYIVWVWCNTAISPDNDGSSLVVVFYSAEPGEIAMSTHFYTHLRALAWAEHAEDFSW